MSIIFTDLVDSTQLSGRIDVEDYREIIREYHATCARVIERFECHLAQTLGDGLLIYGGYPVAHENDAERAVHTGLGILEAMQALNDRLARRRDLELAVRVGIHTGQVVVGDVGAGAGKERLALGEVPNVAARLQGLAAPDTLVISEATYGLVEGYFECEPLGRQALKGVAEPVGVYRVLRGSGVQSRLDVSASRGLTPLVGREPEVALLQELWGQAKDQRGQVVLLSGEAGIGKSRLLQVLKDHAADGQHTRLECRSSPYYQNTSLYPIADLLRRTAGFEKDDTPAQRLEKLEHHLSQYRAPASETVPLFSALLSVPVPEDRYPPLGLTPKRQRQRTLESIVAIVGELAERKPVLFILEDLQWTDPTTLAVLDLLIDQSPTASICILATYRPEYHASWGNRSYLTQMTLRRLSRDDVELMVERTTGGKQLPPVVLQEIVAKTDAVPLYVEECVKAVLESETLREVDGHYELVGPSVSLKIPATLHDSLMSRLDRLVTAKAVAQYAAVIGRQFSYELMLAVTELDEASLQRELDRLVDAELVFQRGLPPSATYSFKHALVADIAYQSLLKTTRQQYHQRIAQTLEERIPDTVQTQPELLAYHLTQAGLGERAVPYWHRAGQAAQERLAHEEAVAHLTEGLSVLLALPESSKRAQQELALHVALGGSLGVMKGWAAPEIEATYLRAHALIEQTGDTSQLFSLLWGLSQLYAVRADLARHSEVGTRLLAFAEQSDDPVILVVTHWVTGVNLFHMGEYVASLEHLEEAYANYDPQHHASYIKLCDVDVGVFTLAYMAHALWGLGYVDQAVQRSREARRLAQERHHPFGLAVSQDYTAMLRQLRREHHAAAEEAGKAMALCEEHGFSYYRAWAALIQGWGQWEGKRPEDRIGQMKQGLAALRATGGALRLSYYLGLLAEAHAEAHQTDAGFPILTEAFAHQDTTQERWYESELHRIRGDLLLQLSTDKMGEAEDCFEQALDVARRQHAKSLELRAATSLGRLWWKQERHEEARALLAPVYDWFTEGLDTRDLTYAKTLLDEWA